MRIVKYFVKSIAVILATLVISGIAFPSEFSGEELLKKAYQNQRLVPHEGILKTTVFLKEPLRHRNRIPNVHPEVNSSLVKVRQKNGKMRMDYKSGQIAGLSIIDNGKNIMHLDNRKRTVIIRPMHFSHGDISVLLSNYEVIKEGKDKIAGQPTQIIRLKARHTGNPSKKLWIDTETFMPLRREHYNSDGILTTRSFYTAINYDVQVNESDFSIPKDWQIVQPPEDMGKFSKEQISRTLDFDIVEPEYLPQGYVLDGFYRFHPPPPRHGKGIHIRYIDGLNSISVFEVLLPPRGFMHRMRRRFGGGHGMRQKRRSKQHPPRCKMLGNRQGKAIRIMKGNLDIVIAGDIAEEELQKMANSF